MGGLGQRLHDATRLGLRPRWSVSIWRVPFSYIEDQPLQEEIHDKAQALVGYGFSKVAGLPFQGIRRRPWSLDYGPELLCSSNLWAVAAVANRPAEPDSAPNAAPPHR